MLPRTTSNISNDSENPYEATSTYYSYLPNTLSAKSSDPNVGIENNSNNKIYNMLFGRRYWIATTCIQTEATSVSWNMFFLSNTMVWSSSLWSSSEGEKSPNKDVCAVLCLKSGIGFEPDGTDTWKIVE